MEGAESIVGEEARRLIGPGFRSKAEALAELVEIVEDDVECFGAPLTPDTITAILDRVWDEQLGAQEQWVGLSDSDRLDSAFVELEASGIVARMNFSCCGSCGHSEIGDEVSEGQAPRGYVFFTMQDADRLAEDAAPQLYFDYGAWKTDGSAFDDDEAYAAAATAIGNEVASAFEAAGLGVSWDGSLSRRIRITDLDWRRRLPT